MAEAPTPLVKKLGIKPGHRVAVLNPPSDFLATLGQLPEDVELFDALDAVDRLDIVLWFGTERAGLERIVSDVRGVLTQDGGLWIGWPKRASKIPTEVTDDIVRDVALPTGLVDNKICAIDASWSGIRLVLRRELRTR
ncbi:MAG TPA: DUF3052 family protein [Actinospica sp.]|jgi:hypothetical protein|nr:DUF3052 family protein [Actinospica sp.]